MLMEWQLSARRRRTRNGVESVSQGVEHWRFFMCMEETGGSVQPNRTLSLDENVKYSTSARIEEEINDYVETLLTMF